MPDPADRKIVITNQLYALACEQQDKGNMALYFVLYDIHNELNEIFARERLDEGKTRQDFK